MLTEAGKAVQQLIRTLGYDPERVSGLYCAGHKLIVIHSHKVDRERGEWESTATEFTTHEVPQDQSE